MTKTLDWMMQDALSLRFTRRGLFKGPVAAGAAVLALNALGGVLPAAVGAAAPLDTDLQILNYALTLEHLESAAYKAINGAGVLNGRAATYFQSFGQHEADHVTALTQTIQKLGGTPVQPAQYNFSAVPKDAAGVVQFFQNVEAVGASAYLGAAPSIKDFDVLEAALSIHAVEAEHASALADLVSPGSDLFAPDAFAMPRTPDQVMQIVAPFFAAMGTGGATMPTGMPATGGGFGARQVGPLLGADNE
jgi:hypothetical protein